jgi:hypothetical protein
LKTNELEKPESIREKMPVTGSCWKSAGCKKSCRKTFFQPAEVGLGLDKHQKKAEATGWSTPTPEEALRRLNVLRNFQWSSYPYYVGLRRTVPEWLNVSELLDRVAVRGQRSEYLRMTESRIAHGHEERFENQLKNRLAIGAADFLVGTRIMVL